MKNKIWTTIGAIAAKATTVGALGAILDIGRLETIIMVTLLAVIPTLYTAYTFKEVN